MCHNCRKPGHWKRECKAKRKLRKETEPDESKKTKREALARLEETVFAIHESLKTIWIMDSGATAHMTCRKEWLTDYKKYKVPEQYFMGEDIYLEAHRLRDVIISAFNSKKWTRKHLADVRYVPSLININIICSKMEPL